MEERNQLYPSMQAIQYPLNRLIMDDTIQRVVPVGTYLQHDALLHSQFFFRTFAFKIPYLTCKIMFHIYLFYPGMVLH